MNSRILEDYEILIREDFGTFIGFCPQLNLMVKDSNKDIVITILKNAIKEYIRNLPLSDDEKEFENLINQEKQKAKDKLIKFLENKDINPIDAKDKNMKAQILTDEDYSIIDNESKSQLDYNISTEELDGLFFDLDRAI